MPLQIELMHPRNQCGPALIGIASLVEKLALSVLSDGNRGPTFTNWAEILDHLAPKSYRSGTKYKSYASFFQIDPNTRTDLNRRAETSITRFAEAIQIIISQYLHDDGPIRRATRLLDETDSHPKDFIFSACRCLETLSLESERPQLHSIITKTMGRGSVRIVDHLISVFFRGLLIPNHPVFCNLPLLNPQLVMSEFLGVQQPAAEADNATEETALSSYGLYAVLREARGWSAPHPLEANSIVRDLLWIRRSPEHHIRYSRGQPIQGIYVSVMDARCFIVDEVDLYGSNIILTARVPQHASQEADKLTLIFRAVTTEFTRLRDGIMSGFAGTERYLGAWKLAMIRPQWHMTEQLEALCDKAAIDDLNALYQACQTSGAVGILFSTSLRDADPSVQNRREAFHRIVSDDPDRDSPQPRKALGDLLTKDIRPSLEELVADAVEVLPDMSNLRSSEVTTIVTDVLLEKLNEVAELKWHLIQPAQIITFKEHTTPGERSTKDVLEDIETLLTTTNIEIAFAAAPSC